jgi:hypothetical protein
MLLLNFSHPLPPDQLARLETLTGQPIERDPQAELVPQVVALAEACGLSPAEWQQASILVLPPALNFVAVTLLAELHGRMGYFPAHLRMRPVEGSLPPRFEVAEIINLQAVREEARQKR